MAEASVQYRKLLADPGVRTEPDVVTVGVECKVLDSVLFLIYINDLEEDIINFILKFC